MTNAMSEPMLELVPDFNVHVNRFVRPLQYYPKWVKQDKIDHKRECAGPNEYNLQTDVFMWLSSQQRNHSHNDNVTADTIYDELQAKNFLVSCLNLQDYHHIQHKGVAVFEKLFRGKSLFLWGSVVESSEDDTLQVPFFCVRGNEIVLDWEWVGSFLHYNNPALCFRKKY